MQKSRLPARYNAFLLHVMMAILILLTITNSKYPLPPQSRKRRGCDTNKKIPALLCREQLYRLQKHIVQIYTEQMNQRDAGILCTLAAGTSLCWIRKSNSNIRRQGYPICCLSPVCISRFSASASIDFYDSYAGLIPVQLQSVHFAFFAFLI